MANHKICLARKVDMWLANERTDRRTEKRTGAVESINERDENRCYAAGVEENTLELTKKKVS